MSNTFRPSATVAATPCFVIEGAFFEMNRTTGIARVWMNIFAEWRKDGFLDQVVLFDRGGTLPDIPGARVERLPGRDLDHRLEVEPEFLQSWCDRVGALAFCSTYYAYPSRTPSVALVHDMIPEILGFDLSAPPWREKRALLDVARRFVCVSHNTRRDLERLVPSVRERPIAVAYPGIDTAFIEGEVESPERLRSLDVAAEYIVFIGAPRGYKGFDTLIQAVLMLPEAERPQIVLVSGWDADAGLVEPLGPQGVRRLYLTDAGLRLLLSNALAYVCPSRYEGFGLTLIEAMACGCPVICSDGGSLPEVAGDAALVVPVGQAQSFAGAIVDVRDFRVRNHLIARGLRRAAGFSWRPLATALRAALEAAAE